MADLYSLSSSGSQIDTLVASYRASLQAQAAGALETRRINLTARSTAVAELQTKLTTLATTVKNLTNTGTTSLLKAYSAVSSQTSVLTASASSAASVGTHTMKVSQLAKADTMVSARFTSAGTSIGTTEMTEQEQVDGSATREFRILENGTLKATVSVSLTTGESNSSIMAKVASAINRSTDANAVVGASVVSITSSQSKMVLTSKNTGSSNSISIEDVSGTLLDNLGWSDSVVSGRTSPSTSIVPDDPANNAGGYLYATTSLLDSVFTLDGIAMERETNTFSDALSGVTFDLKSTQLSGDAAVSIAIGVDRTAIRSKLDAFITDYNAVMEFLNTKTSINLTSGTRQILAGDSTFTGMRTTLKEMIYSSVQGVTAGNPKLLADYGITLGSTGKLSVSDSTKFDTALSYDSSKLQELFSATDGIGTKLNSYLTTMTGTSGTMVSRKESLASQLLYVNTQMTRVTARINKQVDNFRNEFVRAQAIVAQITQQQTQIASILASIY